MRCIIVDDEPLAREGMEMNVREVDSLDLVGQFESAVEANNYLADEPVDLIFLDIQMPDLSGLEFIRSMKDCPLVILTTAYPEYALEGFELDVVDYLVKPIRMQRFLKSVNKAREIHEIKSRNGTSTDDTDRPFVYLKSERKYVKVYLDDIVYIEGMKDYVMVQMLESRLMTAMNVKTINKQLDDSFFVRVSKSYIINVDYIEEVSTQNVIVNGKEISIGKTYKDHFFDNYINDHLISR